MSHAKHVQHRTTFRWPRTFSIVHPARGGGAPEQLGHATLCVLACPRAGHLAGLHVGPRENDEPARGGGASGGGPRATGLPTGQLAGEPVGCVGASPAGASEDTSSGSRDRPSRGTKAYALSLSYILKHLRSKCWCGGLLGVHRAHNPAQVQAEAGLPKAATGRTQGIHSNSLNKRQGMTRFG